VIDRIDRIDRIVRINGGCDLNAPQP